MTDTTGYWRYLRALDDPGGLDIPAYLPSHLENAHS